MAIRLIDNWGLHYRGVQSVWIKTRIDGAIIGAQGIPPTFTKPTTELLLAATTTKRGRPFPIHTMKQAQVVQHKRLKPHSKKPDVFRDRLVELCGDIPRIELFARCAPSGWDIAGKDAPRQDVDILKHLADAS